MPNPDDALLWNFKPRTPTRPPRQGASLWTLRKDERHMNAEILQHGEYGWEVRLFENDELYLGQRFDLCVLAVAHGEAIRRRMLSEG
jgi:hypothetical protein